MDDSTPGLDNSYAAGLGLSNSDSTNLNAALDAYIGQNPSIIDSVPSGNNPPAPPNPWLQGIGLAASGFPIPDAQPVSPLPSETQPPNPWLQGLSQAVTSGLPQTPTPVFNNYLDYITLHNNPYLEGLIDSDGNLLPEYQPDNSTPESIQAALNAYLASQNLQPANPYATQNPAPPSTGYEGIVPTPQPPYPMTPSTSQQANILDYNPPYLSTTPPVTPSPNPVDPSLANAGNAYYGKLLTGSGINPYSPDLPANTNSMMQTGTNPLAPDLPQDLSALLSPTINPYASNLPEDRGSMMRESNSPFPPSLSMNNDSIMSPNTTSDESNSGIGQWQRNIFGTVFGGIHDLNNSAYTGIPITDDSRGVSLPAGGLFGQYVQVKNLTNNKIVTVPVIDRGPHNINDAYWNSNEGGFRPLAEGQYAARNRAQNGKIPPNPAGIDLAPGTADDLGIKHGRDNRGNLFGDGNFDWRFVNPPQNHTQ